MMLDDLLDPEAQSDPHHWGATFCAHAWLALGPWGALAILIDQWTAAWIIPLAYLVGWEGYQWYAADKKRIAMAWDAVLDTAAIAFGCYAAACLGNGLRIEAVICWCASMLVAAVGWRVRDR